MLFDAGHGERFVPGQNGPLQLSGLAEILTASGCKVGTLSEPISDASLAGADALIISGAFQPLAQNEIPALIRFMQRGGRVSIMLHIAPPLGQLLENFGITFTNGVIEEQENLIENQPHDFRVTRMQEHPVFQGIKSFNLYGVWGLKSLDPRSRDVASTSPRAWIDLRRNKVRTDDETMAFAVACAGEVGTGGFLVFGDDAIFQNKFLNQDNRALAQNLASWLKNGKPPQGPGISI
ncbi:hypothetical protein GMLC_18460 [Geomonas limicola]|uniref:DUF4350 domain-containing protein n=1 Tax=Geomonas limicola TaxID=2740186 RepID=A0A6V8N903_9BACT|nr:GldG family protein [Geomonas limicola]GFO68267.1 hypothetical protein GMLC_18460 [Geomonas limicola]